MFRKEKERIIVERARSLSYSLTFPAAIKEEMDWSVEQEYISRVLIVDGEIGVESRVCEMKDCMC